MSEAQVDPPIDDRLEVCECGHIESFHDDGTGQKGTWCLALNCGCGTWKSVGLQ